MSFLGRGLLHRSRAHKLFPCAEWRRALGAFLFCLPVPLRGRPRAWTAGKSQEGPIAEALRAERVPASENSEGDLFHRQTKSLDCHGAGTGAAYRS